jgi:hypothetical protein
MVIRGRSRLGDDVTGGGGNTITPDQLRDPSNQGPNNLIAPFDVTGDSTVVSVDSAEGQAITRMLQAEASAGHGLLPGRTVASAGTRLVVTKPGTAGNSSNMAAGSTSSLAAPLLQTYAGIPAWGWLAGGVVLLAVFS